jgi:signal transduction histidine kinase
VAFYREGVAESMEPRYDPLEVIRSVSLIVEQAELEELIEVTIGAAVDLTGARYGALGVLNDHGRLVAFHHKGLSAQEAGLIGDEPTGRGVLGDITSHGVSVRSGDITSHATYTGVPAHHPEMSSFLGVPVTAGGKTFGNLYVTNRQNPFDVDDEAVMTSLAVAASAGISAIRVSRELTDRAVSEDRNRIARDVHDSIIQNLFAVGLDLQSQSLSASDPEARALLGASSLAIDAAIGDLRRLIHDLHEDVERKVSLAEEIDSLVMRLSSPHEIPVEVSFRGASPILSEAVLGDVLQIVREATSNALRHSSGTIVTVTIVIDERSIFLSISDDGDGFDVLATPHGLGLANMRTRARRAGGELNIVSAGRSGTSVEARIPVPGERR